MKKLGFVLLTILFSSTTYAQSFGVFGGFNSTEYDATGANFDRELGIELGASLIYMVQDQFGIRSGAGIVTKNSSVDTPIGTTELGLTYLEIPATAFFAVNEAFQIFGGLNFDINIADDCEAAGGNCSFNDTETLVFNLPIGARFNLRDNHNLETILEFGLSDIAGSSKIGNSFSVRYVYMFAN